MLAGDILMSPSVAPLAVKQRDPSTITPEVTGLIAKCMPQYVLSVAKNVKCPLSLERAGRYIVVNAIAKINRAVGNNSPYLDSKGAGATPSPRRSRSRKISMLQNVCLHAG
jgi:hypothetical protein